MRSIEVRKTSRGGLSRLALVAANPTRYGGGSGTIAYAKCSNSDDNSGVTWTCQTTS